MFTRSGRTLTTFGLDRCHYIKLVWRLSHHRQIPHAYIVYLFYYVLVLAPRQASTQGDPETDELIKMVQLAILLR